MAALKKTDTDRLADAEDLIRKRNAENTDLRKTIKVIRQENDTAEKIRTDIFRLAAHSPEPPTWLASKGGPDGSRGAPMTIWSDWHYGEVVNPEEIGGVNHFNAEIAQKRVTKLVNKTIDLSFNHMGRAKTAYPGIIVCLGGDMVGGAIHPELEATNDRTTHQAVHELTDLLCGAIDQMATKFGRVFLPCVVGNHGRSTMKPRMKGHVYTNYDWLLYTSLERAFARDKRVQFLVPSEADAHFSVFGHRYHLTHGDNLGVRGGDGIIGALGPIVRGAIKVGRSEAQIGRDYDTLIIGHWHQYLSLPGIGIICNGTLKGYDEYARLRLRASYERPNQALWFTHPEHGITASWPVYLEPKRKATDTHKWVEWLAA